MTISPALFPAVTVTVVRDRKIRTALRTNQIAGFVAENVKICGKNIIDILGYRLMCQGFHWLLSHFDVIYNQLLNRRTVT